MAKRMERGLRIKEEKGRDKDKWPTHFVWGNYALELRFSTLELK